MNAVMQLLQTTFSPLALIFTVPNLAATGRGSPCGGSRPTIERMLITQAL